MMKFSKAIRGLSMVAVLGGSMVAGAHAQETYSFGVVPQFEALRLNTIWAPILDELSTATGQTFKIVASPNIPEFEVGFSNGDFDFAYMNPYHSIMAKDAQG